jgi:hypothetical protein
MARSYARKISSELRRMMLSKLNCPGSPCEFDCVLSLEMSLKSYRARLVSSFGPVLYLFCLEHITAY